MNAECWSQQSENYGPWHILAEILNFDGVLVSLFLSLSLSCSIPPSLYFMYLQGSKEGYGCVQTLYALPGSCVQSN